MKSKYSNDEIEKLIMLISKLPGFGPKSASRAALHLLNRKDQLMIPLAESLISASSKIIKCNNCGNIDLATPCSLCEDQSRKKNQICVVESVADLWALEKSGVFSGDYHVLGGTLSAINSIGPDELNLKRLIERVSAGSVNEVIIALGATVDGQTTAHYIADSLSKLDVSISRLGHGVPIGGELDYMDEGTIAAAMNSRQKI